MKFSILTRLCTALIALHACTSGAFAATVVKLASDPVRSSRLCCQPEWSLKWFVDCSGLHGRENDRHDCSRPETIRHRDLGGRTGTPRHKLSQWDDFSRKSPEPHRYQYHSRFRYFRIGVRRTPLPTSPTARGIQSITPTAPGLPRWWFSTARPTRSAKASSMNQTGSEISHCPRTERPLSPGRNTGGQPDGRALMPSSITWLLTAILRFPNGLLTNGPQCSKEIPSIPRSFDPTGTTVFVKEMSYATADLSDVRHFPKDIRAVSSTGTEVTTNDLMYDPNTGVSILRLPVSASFRTFTPDHSRLVYYDTAS